MSDLTPETRAEWREHLRTGGLLPRADQLALLDALEKAERERDDLRAAVECEVLTAAARYLRNEGVLRFDEHGPHDARGAALWDAGCVIDPNDGNALVALLLAEHPAPEPPSGDVAAAIATIEDSRRTHVEWRDYWLEAGDCDCPDHATYAKTAGDRAHQERCIAEYDNVLAVLRTAIPTVVTDCCGRLLPASETVAGDVHLPEHCSACQFQDGRAHESHTTCDTSKGVKCPGDNWTYGRPASEPPNETARCPGCAHTCCPYPSLECDGDSDRVRTCGSEVRYSMQASCRRTDTRSEDCTPMIVGLAEEWEAVESPNPVIVQTYRLAAEELRERLAGQPTEDEVLDSIAACTNPVTRLPKWLQAPALGRDFRPIHAMVVEAIRERYHLVPKGPS